MKKNDNSIKWENATWDGSRIAQLKNSLKLTPKQRFEALEDFSVVNDWFSHSLKITHKHSST
ncbi:hypothetical protein [sulfur-oxidizing endosymbiont of Gigantopelta aegis]|uniref:hypothetical protein n=1 Tax=sulfur-oxidizing endosymbiont of Gigantopelta aegis TaxID=2794934 RepID=UPI0018DCB099|nr:hypothetical protein [sulfur-oxidizing endosymbiont of Gigantopelta aegis]